ncbi:MAG: hypothetical protein J2O48_05455 [Solirubrobacterales bacterium]|nr:hypothetical protein [Solirubrobacterales bacterium]
MLKRPGGFAMLVAVVLAALVLAPGALAGGVHCSGSVMGGFFGRLAQRGTSCARARTVMRGYVGWITGVRNDQNWRTGKHHVDGYLCAVHMSHDEMLGSCRAKGRHITFVGHP